MLGFAKLRCVIRELLAGLLMFWIRGTPGLSDSFVTEHQIPSRRSSASLCRGRSISGPAAD